MAYNILGINPFHDGSVCLLSDGEVISYIEEERLSFIKKDANPFLAIQKYFSEYKIDAIVLGGLNQLKGQLGYTKFDPIQYFVEKLIVSSKKKSIHIYDMSHQHHFLHIISSLHNSGFNEAVSIVIDGGGSRNLDTDLEEATTITYWDPQNSKPFTPLKKFYRDWNNDNDLNQSQLNIANFYSAITYYLGFNDNQEGKTMGLSSYGNPKEIKAKKYFNNYTLRTNLGIIDGDSKKGLVNYLKLNSSSFPPLSNFDWHKDPSKLPQNISNLALSVQNECQKTTGDLIEEYLKQTNSKNVVCSGGYFLNCVSNYYLIKRFPNINFYFDPICHDGGTAIGAALSLWKNHNQKHIPKKRISSIYLGPQYTKEQLLEGIKKYT